MREGNRDTKNINRHRETARKEARKGYKNICLVWKYPLSKSFSEVFWEKFSVFATKLDKIWVLLGSGCIHMSQPQTIFFFVIFLSGYDSFTVFHSKRNHNFREYACVGGTVELSMLAAPRKSG